MDRICINKSTGELIEMQSGGDDSPDLMEMRLNTLFQNAINNGYKEEDIEVKWVSKEESKSLMEPSHAEKKRKNAIDRLEELDKKSIRAMREWLSKVENPPGFIINFEQEARAARMDL